jgi:hypothetical protein
MMPSFEIPKLEKLDSQPEVQKLLEGLLKNQGVQTFLWTGPEGSGKKTFSLALVRSLFCKEGAECPGCATCKQVVNKTHPDLFWVHRNHFFVDPDEPEYEKEMKKQGITVAVAKYLSRKLHKANFSAPLKVAVVLAADELNKDAQDMLLKTLEEPPANSLIILLTEKPGLLKPTILSRCRRVRFAALPTQKVEDLLVRSHGWEKSLALRVSQEVNGNMALALKMGDPVWMGFRDKVHSNMDGALQRSDDLWLNLSTEYDKWEPEFLEEKERTANQRKAEVLTAVFQVYMGLWSRRLAGGAEIPVPLSSLPADVVLMSLQKHQDMIPSNLSPKMILDHLFLELREGFRTGKLINRSFTEMAVDF